MRSHDKLWGVGGSVILDTSVGKDVSSEAGLWIPVFRGWRKCVTPR